MLYDTQILPKDELQLLRDKSRKKYKRMRYSPRVFSEEKWKEKWEKQLGQFGH